MDLTVLVSQPKYEYYSLEMKLFSYSNCLHSDLNVTANCLS